MAIRRTPPHLAFQQCQVQPSDRGSSRSKTPTPQPQPRPHFTSRPSPPQPNGRGSFRFSVPQSDTGPGPPSRPSKLKFKERGSLRSGHALVTDANRGSTAGIGRWREKKREGGSGRRFQPKRVQVDLYIPSTVSVGQLAKLLNVRLRMINPSPQQIVD